MPRLPSGVYVLPASNPVTPFTVITSEWANSTMSDIASVLTKTLDSTGLVTAEANLPMGGKVHTGVGKATLYNQYARADQVQFNEFNAVTEAAGGPVAYVGTLPFGLGNTVPPQPGMPIVLVPPVTNTGAATLALSGGTAYPIVNANGTTLTAGRLLANQPVQLIWNSLSSAWTLISNNANAVQTVTSADPAMLTATQPTAGNTVLTPIVNQGGGMVKLGADGKVPASLLPAAQTLIGMWDASSGAVPPNATLSGQYYLITVPGTMTVYASNGAGGWTLQAKAFVINDQVVWNQNGGQPTGWYYVAKVVTTTAAGVTNTATPSFAATNLQAWINAADSVSGFALTNGTRPFTGMVQAVGYNGPNGVFFGHNITYNAGWKFISATGIGATLSTIGSYVVQYVSADVSTGANSPVVNLVDVAYWSPTNSYVRTPLGIGGAPRTAGGVILDAYGNGTVRAQVQDMTSGITTKLVAASSGSFLDCYRQDAAGAINGPGGPFTLRLSNAVGGGDIVFHVGTNKQVQIGDNSKEVPGSICSTVKNVGTVSGPLDFRQCQTYLILAGSNITAVTMAPGQVGRIWVASAGSITLPANVKLPRGGAVYGALWTMISLVCDAVGVNAVASFVPYDSA